MIVPSPRIWIFFLSIVLGLRSNAQTSNFINYSTSEGLVNNTVFDFYRDADSFLWIASASGISRFDGYEFKNFTHKPKDPFSLHGTAVYSIDELNDTLWLSTDIGLEYFDKETERFYIVEDELIRDNLFSKNVCVDEKGYVWAYSRSKKMMAYSPSSKSVVKYITSFADTQLSNDFFIYQFLVVDQNIWMATNKGVAVFEQESNTFTILDSTVSKHCHNIRKTDNTILVSYMSEGVGIIDIASKDVSWVKIAELQKIVGGDVSLNDALIEKDGSLWVSVGPGLVCLNKSGNTYFNYDSKSSYFEGNVVSCMYRDFDNNVWIGTYEHGIYLKRKSNNFTYSSRLYKDDVKKTLVTSCRTFGNGSLLYSDTKNVYFCSDYKNLRIESAEKIFSGNTPKLFPINDRYCYIVTDSFYVFDSKTKTIETKFYGYSCASTYIDDSELLWVGTWYGVVYGLSNDGSVKYKIYLDQKNITSVAVYDICGGSDGSLWLGTFGEGLVHVLNPRSSNPQLVFYNKKKNASHYLSTNYINCLHMDKDSNLWIGTNGAGLGFLKRNSSELLCYSKEDGLQSDLVEAIISDDYNTIWFSSNVLTRFNRSRGTFTHFSAADGVQGNFVSKGCLKTKDGDLLFGTKGGIYTFNPLEINDKSYVFAPVFTSLKVSGISIKTGDTIGGIVPIEKAITYSNSIALPFSYNSFTIEFASVQFHEAPLLQYQYLLDGIDKSWVSSAANRRFASYAGLLPGEYTFKVRASYKTGEWSAPTSIVVKVIPPWWRTAWFQYSSILGLIIITAILVMLRIRTIKTQNITLENKVNQRTTRLKETNTLLQESHVVLEMKNEQLDESLKAKDKLIRVIAHDFKNPLASVKNLVDTLKHKLEQFDVEQLKEMLNSISSATNNLNNQMQNVLDWAMAEGQDLIFKPKEINIETLINDVLLLTQDSAKQKNIAISLQLDYETNAFIDPRMISTVLRNLLINAIRFTPRNGNIAVVVQEYENELEVSIVDSGVGMDDDIIKSIFNSSQIISTAGTENEQGSGIGLRLSKQFVERNKGVLIARSETDRGSVFTFTVPKGENSATRNVSSMNKRTILARKFTMPVPSIPVDKEITILLIDDNENMVHYLARIFEQYYSVISAYDGQSGLQLANNVIPSLIVSDISMPQISGLDLCQVLKGNELTQHIPIVLITANEELMMEGYERGADDFIVKPFEEAAILAKTHALLENRKRLSSSSLIRSGDKSMVLPESYEDKILSKIVAYVNEHYLEPDIDAVKIAEDVGLSRTQLWRKFKSATNQNLSDYIKTLRLERAREMLLTGKYKISEVAYLVGYSNAQYFSKRFSKHFGYSPKECIQGGDE